MILLIGNMLNRTDGGPSHELGACLTSRFPQIVGASGGMEMPKEGRGKIMRRR